MVATELNGCMGTILSFNERNGRYVVELDGGGGEKQVKAFKPENMEAASPDCGYEM